MVKLESSGNRLQGIRIQYTGARVRSTVEVVSVKKFCRLEKHEIRDGGKGSLPSFFACFHPINIFKKKNNKYSGEKAKKAGNHNYLFYP
jgi:hypothetical protein